MGEIRPFVLREFDLLTLAVGFGLTTNVGLPRLAAAALRFCDFVLVIVGLDTI